MPSKMANSKLLYGQGHKDKYLDISRKNAHVQYESSNTNLFRSNDQCQFFFFKRVKIQGNPHKVKKKMVPTERSYHKEYS